VDFHFSFWLYPTNGDGKMITWAFAVLIIWFSNEQISLFLSVWASVWAPKKVESSLTGKVKITNQMIVFVTTVYFYCFK